MSIRKSLGAFNWSKSKAVDEEVVEAIISEDDFNAEPGEEFLFYVTSTQIRLPLHKHNASMAVRNEQ